MPIKRKIKIKIDGVEYESLKALAKKHNVIYVSLAKRYKEGLRGKDLFIDRRKNPADAHIVENIKYNNLLSVAREYNIPVGTIYKRFSRGTRGDDLVPITKRKSFKSEYKLTEKEFAEKIDVAPAAFRARLARGKFKGMYKKFGHRVLYKKPGDDIGPPDIIKKIKIGDNFYSSIVEACRKNNVSYGTFYARVKGGLSKKKALEENKIQGVGAYNKKIIQRDKILANKKAYLYFALVYLDKYVRYKIGVTTGKTIKKRLDQERFKHKRLKYKVLNSFSDTLEKCFTVEQQLLKFLKKHQSKDLKGSGIDGYTEIFDLDDKTLKLVNKIINKYN